MELKGLSQPDLDLLRVHTDLAEYLLRPNNLERFGVLAKISLDTMEKLSNPPSGFRKPTTETATVVVASLIGQLDETLVVIVGNSFNLKNDPDKLAKQKERVQLIFALLVIAYHPELSELKKALEEFVKS